MLASAIIGLKTGCTESGSSGAPGVDASPPPPGVDALPPPDASTTCPLGVRVLHRGSFPVNAHGPTGLVAVDDANVYLVVHDLVTGGGGSSSTVVALSALVTVRRDDGSLVEKPLETSPGTIVAVAKSGADRYELRSTGSSFHTPFGDSFTTGASLGRTSGTAQMPVPLPAGTVCDGTNLHPTASGLAFAMNVDDTDASAVDAGVSHHGAVQVVGGDGQVSELSSVQSQLGACVLNSDALFYTLETPAGSGRGSLRRRSLSDGSDKELASSVWADTVVANDMLVAAFGTSALLAFDARSGALLATIPKDPTPSVAAHPSFGVVGNHLYWVQANGLHRVAADGSAPAVFDLGAAVPGADAGDYVFGGIVGDERAGYLYYGDVLVEICAP
jgi:hypothetical protein